MRLEFPFFSLSFSRSLARSPVRARVNVFWSERQPAPIPFLIAFAFNNRAGEFPRRARISSTAVMAAGW